MIPLLNSILTSLRRVGCSPDRRIEFLPTQISVHGLTLDRMQTEPVQTRVKSSPADVNFPAVTPASISCAGIGLCCVLVASCTGPTPRPAISSVGTGHYAHTLHNRFYNAWQQPASVGLPPGKTSVPVDVTIDSAGDVVDFRIMKSSGNPSIDNSVAAVANHVRRVAPPPGIASGKTFKLRIYFELDVTSSPAG